MHLINSSTRRLEEFIGDQIPEYAILSHTWGKEEVSYADMKNDEVEARLKEGYVKIKYTCLQALSDGLRYAWVDTCCIDKTSSAELSEVINSMFRWYENSAASYVYLSDVHAVDFEQQFPQSRWFTRGWTLHELLAPSDVTFYDCEWIRLGTKHVFAEWLHEIINIEASAIDMYGGLGRVSKCLTSYSCAQKMSWASHRHTTPEEDME